tara:strand:- start:283 stop:525 length:243 start_codon:yes stop_codon:yes gene_type:complete
MKSKKKFKILEDETENEKNKEEIKKEKLKEDQKEEETLDRYIKQLDSSELQAIEIAKKILQSSFCLEKSIGYLEFKKLQD